jgi:hypothetical protein
MIEQLHPSERPADALWIGVQPYDVPLRDPAYREVDLGFQLIDSGRIIVLRIPVDEGLTDLIKQLQEATQ